MPRPSSNYAGFPGLLEPRGRSRSPSGSSVVRPFQALPYAGLRGLLEPSQRNRRLDGSSMFRAFPGPEPGHGQQAVRTQLRVHIRRPWALEGPHPPRTLGWATGRLRGHRSPQSLCRCVAQPALASMEAKPPWTGDPKGSQLRMHGEQTGPAGPVCAVGSVLPGFPQTRQAGFAPSPAATSGNRLP